MACCDTEALSVPMCHVLKSRKCCTFWGDFLGKKCAFNALFSVCLSVVPKVSIWKSYDLDNILIESEKIYKFLNKDDFLSVIELPRRIISYNCNIDINIELQNLHEGVASQGGCFLQDTVKVSDVCRQGYLIFICSYTIVVISSFDRNGDLSSSFLFDSHSRS